MEKMNKTKKLIVTSVLLLVALVFAYTIIGPTIVKASTSGSLLFSYDNSGGLDPDCWTAQGAFVYWGDSTGSWGVPNSTQWDYCLNKAERYAIGGASLSDYTFSVQQVGQSQVNNNTDITRETDNTFETFLITYSLNTAPSPTVVWPVCGSAANVPSASLPTSGLCSAGNPGSSGGPSTSAQNPRTPIMAPARC